MCALLGLLSLLQKDNYSYAFFAFVAITGIGLYTAYVTPVFLRLRNPDFRPGPWNLGRWSGLVGWTAIVWVVIIDILFVLPVYGPVDAFWPPWEGSNRNLFNFAGPVFIAALALIWLWWLVSARHRFTGPRVQGSEEELLEDRAGAGRARAGRGDPRAGAIAGPAPGATGATGRRAVHNGDASPEGSGVTTVLAVDQGTSATKALVVGPGGEVLGEAEVAVHPVALDGGASSRTPRSCGGRRRRRAPPPCERPRSPSTRSHSRTRARRCSRDRATGSPATPALVWQDRRAATCASDSAHHAPRLAALTGLELDPYFVAPKITWLREHVTRDGVATTTGLAAPPAVRRVRHRRRHRSRSLLLDLDRSRGRRRRPGSSASRPTSLPRS